MNNTEIKAYCVKNGKTLDEIKGLYQLKDTGNGAFVDTWNVSGLTEPSQTDLDALTQTEKDTVTTQMTNEALQAKKIALQKDISAGNQLITDGHSNIDVSGLVSQLAAL